MRNEITTALFSAEENTRVTSVNVLAYGTLVAPKLSLLELIMPPLQLGLLNSKMLFQLLSVLLLSADNF